MATRAQQFEILAAGVLYDGATIATPYVKFLAAGTSNNKDAYADPEKAVAITKKALDTQGRGPAFGDGIYKLRFYSGDPDNGGIFKFEIDNYKVTAVTGNTRTVTAASVTGTVDDSLVVCNTTSNSITYTLPDAALMAGKLLQVAKSAVGNSVTINGYGGQLVNGGASIIYTAINSNGIFQTDGTSWWSTVGDATTLGGYSPTSFMRLVQEITLAAPGAITFSGLNGNSTKEFLLEVEMIGGSAGAAMYMQFNADATTANYSTTSIAVDEGIFIIQPEAANVGAASVRIYPRSGLWRMVKVNGSSVSSGPALTNIDYTAAWENTADNITSIVLTKTAAAGAHAAIGTRARLWAIGA